MRRTGEFEEGGIINRKSFANREDEVVGKEEDEEREEGEMGYGFDCKEEEDYLLAKSHLSYFGSHQRSFQIYST